MKLRILLLVSVLILAVSVAAFAQNAPRQGQQQAHPILAKIARELALTKDQAQQIRDIVTKFHQDAAAIFNSSASDDDKKAQIKDLRAKAGDAIMAVLNADQQAKATKMRAVDMLLAPPGARAEMGLMALLSKLDLSADQKTTIKGIIAATEAAGKAIREDTSLDRAAKQAKLQQLWKDNNAKIMAVLTPEQQKKLRQMMQNRKPGA